MYRKLTSKSSTFEGVKICVFFCHVCITVLLISVRILFDWRFDVIIDHSEPSFLVTAQLYGLFDQLLLVQCTGFVLFRPHIL